MDNLFTPPPTFIEDPYPLYREMLRSPAPSWLAHQDQDSTPGLWLFSRYADVIKILKMEGPLSKQLAKVKPGNPPGPLDRTMLNVDPPDHTRLRNLANQAFRARSIQAMEPRIAAIADGLIDRLLAEGGGDFIRGFAIPLPVMVIAEMMGIPHEDRDRLLEWTLRILAGLDSTSRDEAVVSSQREAFHGMIDYFGHLAEARRQSPRDDFISALIQARDQDEKLSHIELLTMCALLLVAGHETTVNHFGTGLYTLLRHPDQLEQLRADRSLLVPAVEEMLRYESPLQRSSFRITTAPCEIGGKRLEAGEQIGAVIGAAHRDPAEFDDPDRFDIRRTPNRHLAFGSGIHYCLGATLARTESRIGFTRLLDRLPAIALAGPAEWKQSTVVRGLQSLPVRCA
jgi:cytochrome P450